MQKTGISLKNNVNNKDLNIDSLLFTQKEKL